MKYLRIKSRLVFFLVLAVLLAIQNVVFTLSVRAQKPTERTEPVEASLLRPNADDFANMLPGEADMERRESLARRAFTELKPIISADQLAPANDNFANAEAIAGAYGSVNGTNVEATVEPGEPIGSTSNKTVWYRWTAPANLSMTFETTAGTLTDTVIGVYTGTAVNALTTMTWNDDINGVNNRRSRVTFIANAGTTYYIQVRGFANTEGTFSLIRQINGAETWKQFNFDGHRGSSASDFAVWRPTTGAWWILESMGGGIRAQQFGLSSDILVPGDYDGDGGTDIAVWRSSTGTFWVFRSLDDTFWAQPWGTVGDIPVQGDFDGDDKADFTVWRPSTGTFWVLRSSNGSMYTVPWGQSTDYLACGDYDGDGKTDFGIQRNLGGYAYFYILRSSDSGWYYTQFGYGTDYIVPGDYDGDGKNDIAVYRYSNNTFYYRRSSDGGFGAVQWGITGDVLAPGDYIGDFKTDICVWRPSEGNFYCLADGGTGSFYAVHFGANGDVPVARSNVH